MYILNLKSEGTFNYGESFDFQPWKMSNITVAFLAPNFTSVVQPLD